ncbi:MAG: hypothetical protein V2J62_01940 [candidate division KSB1 bacterium]|nr:hypothetical protein [candidate division KSB1 bacterium]
MRSFKRMHLVALILLIMSFTNCATFKADLRGRFEQSSGKNYGADGVSVLFIFSHYRQTNGFDAIPRLDNARQRISGFDDFFQDALNEFSNIHSFATFTEYASDVNEPRRRAQKDSLMRRHDYIMKLKFMRTKSFTSHFLGQIASTLSLTLLPVPYRYSYSVELDLYNSDNQLLKNLRRSSALTKWVQTLLIFAYPFHPEKRKKEEIYVEMMHDLFRQIESEKILK